MFYIEVHNKNGKQKGVNKIIINGEEINGTLIPLNKMKETNVVKVFMI